MSLLTLSKKILGNKQDEKQASKKKAAKSGEPHATNPTSQGSSGRRAARVAGKAEKTTESKKASATYSVRAGEMALSLIVSEKSMAAQASQTLVARVNPSVSKTNIATAIEEMFGVKVMSVRTSTSHPKIRRRGASEGKTRRWKKAYITVDDISKINVAP